MNDQPKTTIYINGVRIKKMEWGYELLHSHKGAIYITFDAMADKAALDAMLEQNKNENVVQSLDGYVRALRLSGTRAEILMSVVSGMEGPSK